MRLLRRLLLPTVVSTPIWLATIPVMFRGWSALGDWPGQLVDWIFGLILTFIGLVVFGLPAASLVSRRKWSPWTKVGALLFAGILGGALVALLYVSLLSVGAGGAIDIESLRALPYIAAFGILPGLIVAAVWMALNFDSIGNGGLRLDA